MRHFSGGGGGGQRFSGRSAASRSTGPAIARSNARTTFSNGGNRTNGSNRTANLRSRAVRSALNSHAVAGALHNRSALRDPGTRSRIAATAATAGWHDGRGRGWWRHGHGGYGWVGPLFWPFAYYDLYDYTMWGYGDDPSFWDYGYDDIYAGMFAPYGYDDLTGYLPSGTGAGTAQTSHTSAPAQPASDQVAQMCGDETRDIAGLPIDRIQQAIAPNDAQRAALDDLANASVKAAQTIKAACPTQISLTAPARLAVMQQRVEAMIAAVGKVQPALDKFYGLLNDEQKARLTAIGQDQRGKAVQSSDSLARNCGSAQPGVTDWPTAEIDARLHPTDAQRTSLTALRDASAKAADMLKASCQPDAVLTPPARLAAAGKRLDVMLQAVKTVRAALDDFYGKLTDEQKAQFEAIGPGRSASASSESGTSEQTAGPSRHYRHHRVGIPGIVRHFMAFMR
jgi:LTXXQ motif family protein